MKHTSVKMLALCALFVALTAAGAYIQIPTAVIPFTLQILFVLLAGILLGPKYGALSQLVYVLLGLAGVPILSGGGGPACARKRKKAYGPRGIACPDGRLPLMRRIFCFTRSIPQGETPIRQSQKISSILYRIPPLSSRHG